MKRIEYKEIKDICIIKPSGEMIFFFLEELSKYIKNKIKSNQFRFIFDLTNVTWIDSIGLGLIALAVKSALLHQTKVCLIKPRENIVQLLKMSNLLELVKVFETTDEAMEFLS